MIYRESDLGQQELWDLDATPHSSDTLETETVGEPAQLGAVRQSIGIGAVFCYQLGICLAAAAILVLVNTFAPEIWQSIDRCFQQQLTRQDPIEQDGKQVVKMLQDLFEEPPHA
ncbi:MAG: hypothetical protein ACOX60_04200 [Massiliimalia sp.]|jgi:hypothetical protein